MRRHELTDEQWALIEPLLPPQRGGGRPWRDHRTMLNAWFWILNTGSPWRDLPERFGPWKAAYNRFNRLPSVQAGGCFFARDGGLWHLEGVRRGWATP